MKWRCRQCGATVESTTQASSNGVSEEFGPASDEQLQLWAPYRGVDGRISAVLHHLAPDERDWTGSRGAERRRVCGAADPIPEYDEGKPLDVEVMQGHVRAAIVRCLPPEPAARMLDVFHVALKWGQSIDHETAETNEAAFRAISNALQALPADPERAGWRKSQLAEAIGRARGALSAALRRTVLASSHDGSSTRYVGVPGSQMRGGRDAVFVDRLNVAWRTPLDPRFDLRRHSPDGFAWGYSGSGPAQLALALLAAHFRMQFRMQVVGGGLDQGSMLAADERALAIYQRFKNRVISALPREAGWTLTAAQVDEHVAALEAPAPPMPGLGTGIG